MRQIFRIFKIFRGAAPNPAWGLTAPPKTPSWSKGRFAPCCALRSMHIIGASLSEPHSYVLPWTFVIGDIYIYINRASDRLALCPRRSKPKCRANPVLRLCLPLAFNDNDFLSKGCLCKSPVFLFLHPLHRVFNCPLRQTRSGFFRQAFCLSLPFFHPQEIDDWVRNSAFDFGGR